MVHNSTLRTLTVVLLIVFLTACAATNSSEGAPALSPNGEIFTKSLVGIKHFKEDQTEQSAQEEPADSPASKAAPALSLLDQQTFIDLYELVNPSVVNVQVTFKPDVNGQNEVFPPAIPQTPGFSPYTPEMIPPVMPKPKQAQGSGFVYDSQGYIITNNHVVENADEITVSFADGVEIPASLVGADPDSDLAVIQIDASVEFLRPLRLGDSDSLKVGQLVVAIGNPFGLEGSMTTGIISGLGRLLSPAERHGFSMPDIIQTDAATNPGNSGGPLLNLEGEVIGVNTAIQSPNRVFAGIGYAVPADTVAEVVPTLIENGQIEHPWLGITGATLNRELAEAMGLKPEQRGVLIAEVIVNGPAFESRLRGNGIQETLNGRQVRMGGDIIVGIEDQTIEGIDELISYIIHETEVGQTVTIHILRDSQPMAIEVTLEQRPGAN